MLGPNPSPCEEVVDAARKASTNKPITSSMTAAPRITDASADDILAASINVRAEMDTLVAVSAPPRKSAVVQESPNKRAIPVPRTNGTMTPPSATRNATPLALRMRSMSVSSPAMNIRTKPPICARSAKAPVACPPAKIWRCSKSTAPGPSATPTSSSPRMGGIRQRSQTEAATFTAGSRMATSSAS